MLKIYTVKHIGAYLRCTNCLREADYLTTISSNGAKVFRRFCDKCILRETLKRVDCLRVRKYCIFCGKTDYGVNYNDFHCNSCAMILQEFIVNHLEKNHA